MRQSLKEIYTEIFFLHLGPYFERFPFNFSAFFSLCSNWLQHIAKTIKDLVLYRNKQIIGSTEIDHKNWLLVASKNNYDSLKFLEEALPDTCMIAFNKKTQRLGVSNRLSWHMVIKYWWKFPLICTVIWPKFGKMTLKKLDTVFKGTGLYETALSILKKYRPSSLIFTNDHIPEMVAFLLAGKHLNIPTIYLQHASVSEYFPNLKFDLSLLEGQDTLEKYKACGSIEGEVALIGMPKADHYISKRNLSRTIHKVGLCASLLDDQKRLENTFSNLVTHFPNIQWTFRPHPNDQRRFNLPNNTHRSDSQKETIFEYLTKQDCIIAGDTSTHLEAVMLNISSIYFAFNDHFSDYYSYVKNGLVEKARSVDDLINFIESRKENRPNVLDKAKYYNAVIGTPEDGQSRQLAINQIKLLLSKNLS